ncbi:MAG: hypothetical protein MPJ50_09615 [Pirellulales bacterium]|nr:hypothetical protein [Pirellulales bacterium]
MNSVSKSGENRNASKESGSQPALPTANVRTIVNLLLFMHLFSLAVVLLWQTNSSPASVQLHSIPAGYLKPLHLDVAFDDGHPGARNQLQAPALDLRHRERSRRALLHFTHGGPLDDELTLEFSYRSEDSGTMIFLPPPGTFSSLRRDRFQRLAWEIARAAYDPTAREALAGVLGQALLARFNVEQGELRVVRHRAQTTAQAKSRDSAVANPLDERYRETLIAFDIRTVGNAVTLSVIEQAVATSAEDSTGMSAPAVDGSIAPDDENRQRTAPRLGPIRQGGEP